MKEKTKQIVAESKQMIEETVQRLAERLEQGFSEEMKKYLKAMALFHHYSLGNQILILYQMPKATHVAGYRTWQKMNRFVRKGEKGIRILAPCIRKIDDEESEEDEMVIGFKPAYVFDESQTDGDIIPDKINASGEPGQMIQILESVIESNGIHVSYDHLGTTEGYSAKGTIVISKRIEGAQKFSVLVHEFAHELLHQKSDEKLSKKVVELEADAVACVVCERFGLQSITASSDYIKTWGGDKDSLLERLERIRQCASKIISQIEMRLDEEMPIQLAA